MNEWQCPLCECNDGERLFDSADAINGRRGQFAVMRCRRCSLFSLRPRPLPGELLSLYPPDYEPFGGPLDKERSRRRRWLRRRHYAYRCEAVRHACTKGGRLLDVGCGTGGFLKELCRDSRWQAVGVDISEHALNTARQQGLSVQCGELASLHLPAASFDVVTLWEVIEHVPNPRGILFEIHRLLRPASVLLMSTPNGESWQARLWQQYWAGWDVPRHLQVFSPRTLQQLLQETGFMIRRRVPFPMERFMAVESARRWLRAHVGGSALTIARQLAELLGLAGWPVFRLADRFVSASCIAWEAFSSHSPAGLYSM